MPAAVSEAHTDTPANHRVWCRAWQRILQLALILWICRVVVVTTLLGLLILGLAPQAQDLFVEFADAPDRRTIVWNMFLFCLFLFVLFFVWAMPTHYTARLLLDTDARFQQLLATQRELKAAGCIEAMQRWVPRVLGLLTFVAVFIAIGRSYANLPILDETWVIRDAGRALLEMTAIVLVGAVTFIVYCVERGRTTHLPGLRMLRRMSEWLSRWWRVMSFGFPDPPGTEGSHDLGRLLLAGIFVIFVAIFLFGADSAAGLFPRAMAVPFILGGWLPFLGWFSGAGRRVRAPLLVGLFVLVAVLAVVLGDNHSVRRIDAAKAVGDPVDTGRMPLDAAVALWMRENNCQDAPASCPRPIVIAAAGGASRAAFFTATIVGYFMQEAADHGLDPNKVRNRLFAISGVSGGATGAVMVTAALAAKADANDHPCTASQPFALWYGEAINNWRDCFEALTSGDFLSADFFGFAFNDMLPFGPWRDRAGILEDTWDSRFQAVLTRPDKVDRNCTGLACPFLALRPRDGHWIPLLVLNGTSEATGGRIVTTLLAETYAPNARMICPTSTDPEDPSRCILFAGADYFHDLLADNGVPVGWLGRFERWLLGHLQAGEKLDDVRLSTAALNSARFPFISPAGVVRNQQHAIVDRIVDGGYFENYGALSAKEVALAIHALRPELAPLVVVISNDPDDLLDPASDTDEATKMRHMEQRKAQLKKARAAINSDEPVTDVLTPAMTIANARTAHGLLGVAQMRSALHLALPKCKVGMVHIRVWPQQLNDASKRSRAVSMSWWLSKPIQRHLHQQTEGNTNDNDNGPRLQAIWDAMQVTSGCATAQVR